MVANRQLHERLEDHVATVEAQWDDQRGAYADRCESRAEPAQLRFDLDIDTVADNNVKVQVRIRAPIASTE